MLNDETIKKLRQNTENYLWGIKEPLLSIGRLRNTNKNSILFSMLIDANGRIIFISVANSTFYQVLRGFAIQYAFPTQNAMDEKEMPEEEFKNLTDAGTPPFTLLFLNKKNVIEHLSLNPTGALLWAARFWGSNEISPHLECFENLDSIYLRENV